MERVARRANVPLRTAKRELKADELRTALMEDLLRIRPGEAVDAAQFAEFMGQLLDHSQPLGSQIGDIADALVDHNEKSDLFRAMVAFWALSPEDQDVQDRIHAMYAYWIRSGRDGLSTMLMEQPGSMPLRSDWITIEDFVRAMNAVIEGLAIQRTVSPEHDASDTQHDDDDIEPMDPRLARKVMLSVFVSMLDLDGASSTEHILEQTQALRDN